MMKLDGVIEETVDVAEDVIDDAADDVVEENIAVALTEEDSVEQVDEPEPPEQADQQENDVDAEHEKRLRVASNAVAGAALELSRAQEHTKLAKKDFEGALDELKRLIERGPERFPLFDSPADEAAAEEPEAHSPAYLPPLTEPGQVRVHVSQFDDDTIDELQPGQVAICQIDEDGDLAFETDGDNIIFDDSQDGLWILEEWLDGDDKPTIHDPPKEFGKVEGEPPAVPGRGKGASPAVAEGATSNDAWRIVPIAELGLPKGLAEKLEEARAATIGQLEDLRAEIYQGKAKWPKGVGYAKITKIEDAVLDWLQKNRS